MPGARNWRPIGAPSGGHVPAVLRPWIETPGSLTARMRRRCGDAFRVQVIGQHWQRPWRDERLTVGIREHRVAWVREVILCDGDTPWIYARSVIPTATLGGTLRRLRALGHTPLGRVLFGRYPLRRGPIEVARLGPGDGLRRDAEHHGEAPAEWARRSVFRAGGRALLVAEVFLPALRRAEEDAA
ncbi:chorismate--pyruvate lyase family protein [Arhodomonas aquaeolei]|uniref:chorismate--pyruvate lyase family protein n=1 Tax=Arhodomonas aquaeolei TaxID=2369 RepID=UPI0005902F38|nr:chorismate lyase [Arhodomonas aquaeolei]